MYEMQYKGINYSYDTLEEYKKMYKMFSDDSKELQQKEQQRLIFESKKAMREMNQNYGDKVDYLCITTLFGTLIPFEGIIINRKGIPYVKGKFNGKIKYMRWHKGFRKI